ncbi:DUF4843 domain-containing protein [Solitalea koreensis]|uniref:DUF4843 domain-containing protein n=1 Tax=Solitalea koreensis TaxID=543615 RepID=A0A521DZ51_9SPHI|nr:DUF4843 domain-containing protein [Solitalea koreensis]SMO76908.1 protein of unknown function [Solitalea koreensis]
MKKLFHILSFFAILSIVGCEEKPTLFTETDGLYFGTADTVLNYSFAKYPYKTFDTLQIPVNVLGNSFSADRPISVEVQTASWLNAVDGVHYKVLSSDAVVRANAYKATIPVVVYRTPDLEANMVKIKLKLKTNEAFQGEGITTKQAVTINLAYMMKPTTWGIDMSVSSVGFAARPTNFGTWTKAKYKLMLEALYDPATGATVTEFPITAPYPVIYNQYVAVVRNYIKTKYPGNYGLGGPNAATLTDPDAPDQITPGKNLIQVGPANY